MDRKATHKEKNFLNGELRERDVTYVPGIGEVSGIRLAAKGFDKVNRLKFFQ